MFSPVPHIPICQETRSTLPTYTSVNVHTPSPRGNFTSFGEGYESPTAVSPLLGCPFGLRRLPMHLARKYEFQMGAGAVPAAVGSAGTGTVDNKGGCIPLSCNGPVFKRTVEAPQEKRGEMEFDKSLVANPPGPPSLCPTLSTEASSDMYTPRGRHLVSPVPSPRQKDGSNTKGKSRRGSSTGSNVSCPKTPRLDPLRQTASGYSSDGSNSRRSSLHVEGRVPNLCLQEGRRTSRDRSGKSESGRVKEDQPRQGTEDRRKKRRMKPVTNVPPLVHPMDSTAVHPHPVPTAASYRSLDSCCSTGSYCPSAAVRVMSPVTAAFARYTVSAVSRASLPQVQQYPSTNIARQILPLEVSRTAEPVTKHVEKKRGVGTQTVPKLRFESELKSQVICKLEARMVELSKENEDLRLDLEDADAMHAFEVAELRAKNSHVVCKMTQLVKDTEVVALEYRKAVEKANLLQSEHNAFVDQMRELRVAKEFAERRLTPLLEKMRTLEDSLAAAPPVGRRSSVTGLYRRSSSIPPEIVVTRESDSGEFENALTKFSNLDAPTTSLQSDNKAVDFGDSTTHQDEDNDSDEDEERDTEEKRRQTELTKKVDTADTATTDEVEDRAEEEDEVVGGPSFIFRLPWSRKKKHQHRHVEHQHLTSV